MVGGGLISAGNVLIEPTRRAFADLVEAPFARAAVEIEPALLGSQAGAIGAGLLAERPSASRAGQGVRRGRGNADGRPNGVR